MSRIFLLTLLVSLFFQASHARDTIPIWGDFFFDMKRKQAINLLKKHCKKIDYETEIYVGISGKKCSFSTEPFQNTETSIDLVFDHAFFKINKRLRYIAFRFDDYNRRHLERLYKYSKLNWFISGNWNCNSPANHSSLGQTVQICGAAFNNGKVHLINSISRANETNENLYLRDNHTTSMYFYAIAPKYTVTGHP